MILLLLLILILIWCEVLWDWYHEVKLNEGPNYKKSNLLRVVIGTFVWGLSPIIYRNINEWQYWLLPFIMVPLFSFVFDWGLNIMRNYSGLKREYYYLGFKSKMDIWQREHGGAKLWFYIKGSIVLVLLILFYWLKT